MDCHRSGASCEVCHVADHGSATRGRHQQQLLNTPKHSGGSSGNQTGFGMSTQTLDAEAPQPGAERADPERLGRVVAGAMKWMPASRVRHHVLARLAGQERVEAERDRPAAPPRRSPTRCRSGARARARRRTRWARGRSLRARARTARRRDAVAREGPGPSDVRAAELPERPVPHGRAGPPGSRCCRARDARRAAGGRRRERRRA